MSCNPLGSLAAGDMNDLVEALAKAIEPCPYHLVEVAGSLASAGDEQVARGHGRRARLETVTQGDSGEHDTPRRYAPLGSRERCAHRGGCARKKASGQTWSNIFLMQHVRDAAHPSRCDSRRHHVTAHAEHDVRPELIDDAEPGAQGCRDDGWKHKVLPDRVTVETADADCGQLEAGSRQQPLLGRARAPDQQPVNVRFLSAKGPRDRERRIKVPAGPAASYQKTHLSSYFLVLRLCPAARC